ncbi:uncharacterized protein BJ212DRAFT_789663 [Suillus subaureus]|uniref:Anaphase-promoting complex subunit 4 WD40 domain-containing protein n=1 Tax=Suillus subaureus TaxID=48587 RepID=A0A9P7DY72_9AGAM|nr:uncharacterized protein BJ212DRAFT_789663 [Suillus subaureus]KAG1806080.1 hypothetical protein BJ212DRAFT_789663 [Suillus subaureus]
MSSPTAKTSAVTPRKTMRGHTDPLSNVAHLPDGQRIITSSWDGSLRLWDLESGVQIGDEWRDQGVKAGVGTMALSPNGKTVASGNRDRTVRLWDIETGKVIAGWQGHTRAVESVCWSPNGKRVVSGSVDGTARVWDVKHVKSGEPVKGLNPIKTGDAVLWAVSYSPKATMVATGGFNRNVKIWDAIKYPVRYSDFQVLSIAVKDNLPARRKADHGIKIWDAKTGKLLNTVKLDGSVTSLAWTSDEKKLISGLLNGLIRIFDTATWQQIAVLHGTSDVTSITLFQNDRLLASTSYWDKTARLWNLDTNLQVGSPIQHEDHVRCSAFSADGKLLSTGCVDKNAYVWDVQAILKTAGLEDLLSIPDSVSVTHCLINNINPDII